MAAKVTFSLPIYWFTGHFASIYLVFSTFPVNDKKKETDAAIIRFVYIYDIRYLRLVYLLRLSLEFFVCE